MFQYKCSKETRMKINPNMDIQKSIPYNDNWQINKSISECNKHMFEQSLCTDVTFVVSNEFHCGKKSPDDEVISREIQAHRYVLISRSPVFWSMFADGGEYMEQRTGKVHVNDVDPDAFYSMLLFLYTEEVDITPESVMYILHVAKKYMISSLISLCTKFSLNSLDASNACLILDHSLFFGVPDLTKSCLRVIMSETEAAFNSPSFTNISKDCLDHILTCNIFSVPEIEVFKACLKWARNVCVVNVVEFSGANIRELLGNSLEKIHFPAIGIKDFGTIVGPTNILLPAEEILLFRYISSVDEAAGTDKTSVPFQPDPFPIKQRFTERHIESYVDSKTLGLSEINSCFTYNMNISSETLLHIHSINVCDVAKSIHNYYAIKVGQVSICHNGITHQCKTSFSNIRTDKYIKVNFPNPLVFERGVSEFQLHFEIWKTNDFRYEGQLGLSKSKRLKYNSELLSFVISCTNSVFMPIFGVRCWIK